MALQGDFPAPRSGSHLSTESVDLTPLFAPVPRLGWQIVPPPAARPSPERVQPPLPEPVPMVPAAKLAGMTQAAVALIVTWFLVVSIDSALAWKSQWFLLLNPLAACTAWWAATAERKARTLAGGSQGTSSAAPVIGWTVAAVLVPYLSLVVQAVLMLKRAGAFGTQLVPLPEGVIAVNQRHQVAVQQWQARIAEFEAAEQRRVAASDLWYPMAPACQLLCFFGGSAPSWSLAITTLGTSLLGSGRRVLIVDLSRWLTTTMLVQAAEQRGIPVRQAVLSGADGAGLPGVLTWRDLVDVVVEAAHFGQQDADASRRERQQDRAILRDIADAVSSRQPSIRVLRAGVQTVIGSSRKPAVDLTDEEYDELTGLYNEAQRSALVDRIVRLEQLLRDLEELDAVVPGGADAARPQPDDVGPPLQVLGVDKRAPQLDNELFVDVLLQLLLHSLRVGSAAQAVIVLGADRLHRTSMDALSGYVQREGMLAYVFFEHLRDDGAAVLGAGGAAAGFFALPNHKEAAEAAAYVGTGYRWVESAQTRSFGQSLTDTHGESGGSGESAQGWSTNQGWNTSTARSQSQEYGTTVSRVNEQLVEPAVLMGLPPTGMLFVEVRPGGRRVVASLDCNPAIAYAPRVSANPLGAG